MFRGNEDKSIVLTPSFKTPVSNGLPITEQTLYSASLINPTVFIPLVGVDTMDDLAGSLLLCIQQLSQCIFGGISQCDNTILPHISGLAGGAKKKLLQDAYVPGKMLNEQLANYLIELLRQGPQGQGRFFAEFVNLFFLAEFMSGLCIRGLNCSRLGCYFEVSSFKTQS